MGSTSLGAFVISLGCGEVSQGDDKGKEGSACLSNGTCDPGLVCLSNLCVKEKDSGMQDMPVDLALPDMTTPDMVTDLPAPDISAPDQGQDQSGPDGPVADLPLPDAPPLDQTKPDLPAPDLPAPDQALPDLWQLDLPSIDLSKPDVTTPDALSTVIKTLQACDKGDVKQCQAGYTNNWNRTCKQIRDTYVNHGTMLPVAPYQYRLTYTYSVPGVVPAKWTQTAWSLVPPATTTCVRKHEHRYQVAHFGHLGVHLD